MQLRQAMNALPKTNVFYVLWRLWLTGALYLLAGAGFVLYAVLWVVRLMQTRTRIAVVGVVLLLLLLSAGLALRCVVGRQGGEPVQITVERGQSLWSVARTLEERRVVCSARGLVLWMKASGGERSMQAGVHRFSTNSGLPVVARALRHAVSIESTLTVHEGLTVEQTAAAVAARFDIDSAHFVALCTNPTFATELGIAAGSLEGYLFPDTYRFAPEASARDVIRRMVGRFHEQYASLRMDSSVAARLNRHQIITLASIVEKEATLASERTRIAGVFHNRLQRGISLGADPTVRYALRKFDGPLRVSELRSTNPYNTRVHRGLPPGPICSPGKGAIQATVAPLQTDELYFVALWDGSGAHYFSRTLTEHERKKMEVRRRNEARLREHDRSNRP